MNLKSHLGQITQYPGVCLIHVGCADSGNRAGVDQKSLPALDVGLPEDIRDMAVTATYQVAISEHQELAVTANILLLCMRHNE